MERKWNANGTQMERKWNANGTEMERKCNGKGTHMERKWNGNGTHMERRHQIIQRFSQNEASIRLHPTIAILCQALLGKEIVFNGGIEPSLRLNAWNALKQLLQASLNFRLVAKIQVYWLRR